MQGNYFFADYAQTLDQAADTSTLTATSAASSTSSRSTARRTPYGDIVYLTEGPDGALYYVDLGYSDIGGTFGVSKIRRIRYLQSNQAPVAIVSADRTSGPQPLDVTFSSAGSNDPEGQPITYSWDFGDGTSSTASNPVHTYTNPGQYVVRLTVSDGVNSSISTPLTISVGNVPERDDRFADRWRHVPRRRRDHATEVTPRTRRTARCRPAPSPGTSTSCTTTTCIPGPPSPGCRSGTFTIPTSGHDFQGNTRYRITLTVTDSNGLKDTKSVIVWPQKVNLSFDTVPSGLTLYLDGVARTTPFVLDTLIGFSHTIDARDQSSGSNNYVFSSWSDGGAPNSRHHGPECGSVIRRELRSRHRRPPG